MNKNSISSLFLFAAFSLAVMLGSCTKTPEELYEEQKSGVVMVINRFYYEMKLPNGNVMYFTGIDEDGDIEGFTGSLKEARENAAVSFGTAFFIDNHGSLLTNRHVASPPIDKEQVKENFTQIMSALQELAAQYMTELEEQYAELESEAQELVGYDDYGDQVIYDEDRMQELQAQAEEMNNDYIEAQKTIQSLEEIKNPAGMIITPVCELGIALDGTSPADDNDFLRKHPCRVVRTGGDAEVDLALLKLSDGVTPPDVYIFDPMEADDNLAIGNAVYMIGYNAGVELSYTKKGILSQLTTGKVTQRPDGSRVLYDIATVQGSSGSPVLNEKGQLVAVNFAKYARSDNFNLGIPLNVIRNFLRR